MKKKYCCSSFEREYILPSFQSGRKTVMFWGWICGHGSGALVQIAFNADDYVDILDQLFVPLINALFGEDSSVNVVEDSYSINTAGIVADWYADHP